jgi:WD40 repeat protein
MISNEEGTPVSQFLGQYISALGPRAHRLIPNIVRLWDVETVREIGTFHDCEAAMYSPDSKTLVTAHYDGTIMVWDIPPRKPLWLIVGLSAVLWLSIVVSFQFWRRFLGWWFAVKHKKRPSRDGGSDK